jgi:hypothetical protein
VSREAALLIFFKFPLLSLYLFGEACLCEITFTRNSASEMLHAICRKVIIIDDKSAIAGSRKN